MDKEYKEDLIEATGYLACAIKKADDADVRIAWKKLMRVLLEDGETLSAQDLDTLYTYAS